MDFLENETIAAKRFKIGDRQRTRTKYVPAGTPVAVNDVAVLNVSKIAMLVDPAEEPASMTYDVAGSDDVGTSHVSVTVLPLTDDVRLGGRVCGRRRQP